MSNMFSLDEQKQRAAYTAVDRLVEDGLIHSGMKIGLGTGSTAMPAVERLAAYIADGRLRNIYAVPTSFQTSLACEALHIPIFSFSSSGIDGQLDVTIDGADEIDRQKYLIKGGGAALLREKILAYNSTHFVVVADEAKNVKMLAKQFALPIEIIPEARASIMRKLEKYGVSIELRDGIRKKGPVITDNGNFLLDIRWAADAVVEPAMLEDELNRIPGVVENGFFTQKIPRVFSCSQDGTVRDF